jgi:putative oxidoreductase
MTGGQRMRAAERRGKAGVSRRGWNIALWVVQGVLAAAMLGAGISGLAGAEAAVLIFDHIGLGDWLRYLTGGLQVLAAIGLLVPRLAGVTGLALVGMWLIASVAHLLGLSGTIAAPVIFLALSAVVAWGRRDRTAELFGRLSSPVGRSG